MLCALVFVLGVRHGFDPDHLAAIDGLTRIGLRLERPSARYCGVLFSLGHGTVVLAIALVAAALSSQWTTPAWLETFGTLVSVTFLLLIGLFNLRAVLASAPDTAVPLVGIKAPWLMRLSSTPSLIGAAAVGALFALSFDTVSQAVLFAVTAVRRGGLHHALQLGLLFVLGMLVSDGLNGWWISRLITRADQMAVSASRIMSLAVAAISLAVAALGLATLLSPWIKVWSNGKEPLLGGIVVVLVAVSYLATRRIASHRRVIGSWRGR
jgi:high-affinity nickel-transport protein